TVQAKVMRDGREQTLPITIGDRAEIIGKESASDSTPSQRGGSRGESAESRLGVQVQPISPADMRRYGLRTEMGVLIIGVEPNSPADEARLEEGMVITGAVVNGRNTAIQGIEDFRNAEKAWKPGTDVSLRILAHDERTGQWVSTFRTVTVP